MRQFMEAAFNRSNFVTFISIVCIFLFVLLQKIEKNFQNGESINSFINTSFEVFENQVDLEKFLAKKYYFFCKKIFFFRK